MRKYSYLIMFNANTKLALMDSLECILRMMDTSGMKDMVPGEKERDVAEAEL